MIRIGLTGGIAAGKSTVCKYWEGLGATVIDADDLAHASLEKNGSNYHKVIEVLGSEILNEDQSINRQRLGDLVFGNPFLLQKLNYICHPDIRKAWQSEIGQMQWFGIATAVVAVPLLFEINAQQDFNVTVAIGCSLKTQLERLEKRGIVDPDMALLRIQAMWSMEKKMESADFVVWNDRDLPHLRRQIEAVWNYIHSPYARTIYPRESHYPV